MATPKTTKVRAALGFSASNMDKLTAGAKNIYSKMSSDVQQFPSPVPNMPTYLGLLTSLESAQPAVRSGIKGASVSRNNAANALVSGTKQILSYVQALADASPENAAAIIIAAGFAVAVVPSNPLSPLMLKNGTPSGTVLLRAYVHLLTGGTTKSVCYAWQYSVDGQKTWVSLPVTPVSRTTITGITPLTTLAARVAVTVGKQPMSDWSPVSTIAVG